MKKITLVLLFCICAVGFSQAQVEPENSGIATSDDLKSVLTATTAPTSVQPKTKKVVALKRKSIDRERSLLAPKDLKSIEGNYEKRAATEQQKQVATFMTAPKVGTVSGNHEFSSSNSRFTGPPVNNPAAGTATRLANVTGNQNRAPVVITHSVTQTNLAGNSVTCNAGGIPDENSFYRDFDLAGDFGIPDVFTVTDVEFGVDTVTGPVDLTLNIYSMTGAFPANFGSAVLQGTATYTADVGDAQTIISVPLAATIPAGERMIYEYRIDLGAVNSLFPASNDEGQTGPSYIRAPACGLTTPGDLAGIGFADQHMVMNVVGDDGTGGGGLELPITFEGQTVTFSDFNGSATQVIANPDPSGVNTSANVAENVVPANAAFAGVNIVVPVDLTDDKFFSMNVWSPLAGTPVLLKLEGGPNPPIERQANLTTTGAWEEIIFDFSSEGAVTYDSVTIFMNFNMTDPANQTFYWDNLVQFSPGGGGGGPCTTEGLSNAFENGKSFTMNLGRIVAHDIEVAADEDFVLEMINLNAFIGATGSGVNAAAVDIYVYADAAGAPGALITSELGLVPTAQTVVGGNFGFDTWDVELDVTDVAMPGQAGVPTRYWIGASLEPTDGSNTFWENSTAGLVGLGEAYDDALGGGFVIDPTLEGVYVFTGTCTPTGGGGGGPCATEGLSNAFENGKSFTMNLGRIVAHDVEVAADEDFVLEMINLNAFIGATGSGVNAAAVDIYVYADAAGAPGALITSELGLVPTAQTVVGGNFGFDTWDVELDITDVVMPGQAGVPTRYWIGASLEPTDGSNTFWENSTAGLVGLGEAYDDALGGGFVIDPTLEGVYVFAGTCTPIGGGPVLEFPITHESQVVPFSDFNGSATQQIANPDASGINTSATVAENVVPANAAFAGVNIVIDVDLTVNKFFAMDVWSPLANTPVLLKLEGGPNPSVERQVNLTTSGAWEEVIFDFSSEGAITFESVTIFMNFNMTDPANQTFYWDNLERLNALPGPPNDLCANAIPMSCGDIVSGTTINATDDSAIAPTCDTTVTSPGVWYIYEDTTGLITDITITMCNGTTDYDSKLSVYTGDCGNLICEVGNDDTCGLQSEVSFQSDGATTFYILVHGFGGATGNFEIEMNCTLVPPPNDMIANSIDVDEIGFPYTDPSVAMPAATVEAGTPAGCDNAGARGVWYNFVPEGDGTATATITTPGGGLLFRVNNGPLAGSYQAVAADFGAAFTTMLVTEDTVVVFDDDTTGDPNDACDPVLNGADLAGKIAIVRRGACEFGGKALAAQNEGAIAVVVVNNAPGDPIVMGGGVSGGDVTIPVLMVTDVDGEAIIAELSGASVNVSMGLAPAGFSAVTFYTAPNENAVETDLVLVDWFENQCLPGTTATIPTVAGQAYYVYVANHSAVTDIVIDGTNLGTQDNTIEGFVFYPNPAGSTLNLSAQDTIESATIYNMLGQKVLDQNVNATTSELNVSDLATGAYILQVSVNGQVSTYQILKK